MEMAQLNAKVRTAVGKGGARKARAGGMVPGVMYGNGMEAVSLLINPTEIVTLLRKSTRGRNTLISVGIDGMGNRTALLREIQINPLTRQTLHVDLFNVDMATPVRIKVPVKLDGKAEGVKAGGLLEPLCHSIEVECLPGDIPDAIHADVSALDRGDRLQIKDVVMPAGIKAIYRTSFALAAVH